MNKDADLISEAYSKIYIKEDTDFRDQMPDSKEVYDQEELGPEPSEADEYDKMRKEISYEKYPFWDAYHAVKEGAWSEEDFVQWARSVWADGADDHHKH
jgi:hypothetical protein